MSETYEQGLEGSFSGPDVSGSLGGTSRSHVPVLTTGRQRVLPKEGPCLPLRSEERGYSLSVDTFCDVTTSETDQREHWGKRCSKRR